MLDFIQLGLNIAGRLGLSGRYLERGLTDRSIGRACRGTGGEENGRSVCPRN